MFLLSCEAHFDSAHFLAGYQGKCANIHGHRWKIVAYVKKKELIQEGQERGMVLDFGHLKKDLKAMADHLDHAFVIEKDTLKPALLDALVDENFRVIEIPFRPTAEEFSRYFATELIKIGYDVAKVEVYETPTNMAVYEVE